MLMKKRICSSPSSFGLYSALPALAQQLLMVRLLCTGCCAGHKDALMSYWGQEILHQLMHKQLNKAALLWENNTFCLW